MENEIDLTGVDPARWPEIRRRVEVLDEYIALWRPDAATRQEYADRLDMSASNLLTIARVWRLNRSAAALPGANPKNNVAKGRRMPSRVVEIAQAVIAEFGPVARRRDVVAEIERRCRMEDLKAPSSASVSYMMMASRAEADTADVAPEILIDECVLKIPVLEDDTLAMPRVLLAMQLPERRILGVDITFDPAAAASLAKVMDLVEAAMTPDAPPLELRAPHRSVLERKIIGAVSRADAMKRPSLSKMLGAQLGDIPVSYKAGAVLEADKLLATRHSSAIGRDDATKAIMEAVARHNDRMPAAPTTGFSLDVSRREARGRA